MEKFARGTAALAFLAVLFLPSVASAQYSQDFEGLSGSAAGVVLSGQDGYYVPSGVDFMCYTYAGNVLGIVQNPVGGAQFIGGTGPGDGTNYARAERGVTLGPGLWVLWYDFCGIYTGAPPGSNNLGSFSLRQASANTVHINLFTWVDPNNPTLINSTYVPYDQYGNQFPIPGTPPGPEWSNLQPNHWYRCRTVVDLDQNKIVEIGIRDLSGGVEAVQNPTDWWLIGGAGGWSPPDGIRFFGGGGTPGNTTCWDNMLAEQQVTIPTGACCFDNQGDCRITTAQECADGGGDYQGDDTTCEPINPCVETPTVPTTWGKIRAGYR